MKLNFIFMTCVLAGSLVPAVGGTATPWEEGLLQIEARLDAGLAAYRDGDAAAADRQFSDAYFVAYEASGLEIAVRQFLSAKRNYQLEKMFRNLRVLVQDKAAPSALEGQIATLRAALVQDVQALRGREKVDFLGEPGDAAPAPRRAAFVQSLLIIVREGLEAILLLGALVAYVQRGGRPREVRVLYGAAGAAVLASLLTAYVFAKALAVSHARQEVVEGLTLLLASAVLFYVSYWLISKTESRRWHGYIREHVQAAVGSGRLAALATVAFLSVYREGAETVLFYQALLAGSAGASREIWTGLLAGTFVLVAVFAAFRHVIGRLPLGPFFAVTGAFLYSLAFVFAGKGVHELQEGGLVADTPLGFVPHIETLGIFPSVQAVVVQSLFLLAFAIAAARWLAERELLMRRRPS